MDSGEEGRKRLTDSNTAGEVGEADSGDLGGLPAYCFIWIVCFPCSVVKGRGEIEDLRH
jgi:hypothetical protein